ncbi:MAG: hypothetical protein ACUX7D_02620 [Candidatus Methanodesulfokora washburnensis]|jgi:hypothetical protein
MGLKSRVLMEKLYMPKSKKRYLSEKSEKLIRKRTAAGILLSMSSTT